jgi:hypothetical protein
MKSRNFQLRISCSLERNLRIWSRKLQLRILEVCELILEIFSAQRIVLAYWKKRKEERENIYSLNCWKAKKKDVSSSLVTRCGTNLFESSTLNFVLVTQNTLSHTHTYTHTYKKKTLNDFNSKLCSSVKTNKIFEKLQNLILFQNLKTKKSLKKQQNLWKLQNQEIFETLDFNSSDVPVKVLQITRKLLEIFHPNVIILNFCLILILKMFESSTSIVLTTWNKRESS